MRRVRLPVIVVVASAVLSGCGGPSHSSVSSSTPTPSTGTAPSGGAVPSFAAATTRTTAPGTAGFTLKITALVGGTRIYSEENGTVSFRERRAHLYKQIPGSTVPQELVLRGPFTYTNGNVQAALADPTVKPWTKLDTRRLSAKQRAAQPDELAHVVAPAYLARGVASPRHAGRAPDGTARFDGVVDPSRLARMLPAGVRASIATAVRNDYAAKPFAASFWLDGRGRIRRVRVDYRTAQGSRITIDTTYSDFGSKVAVALPAAGDIADISP